MADVILKPVDRTNWMACIRLQVAEDQRHFVASNLFSLAQARVYEEFVPLAVYDADHPETMVGFVMYGADPDDGQMWICRLMVDAQHQRQGFGRAAMRRVMERIGSGAGPVRISYEPDNHAAESLYACMGFHATGELIEGEVVREWRPGGDGDPGG